MLNFFSKNEGSFSFLLKSTRLDQNAKLVQSNPAILITRVRKPCFRVNFFNLMNSSTNMIIAWGSSASEAIVFAPRQVYQWIANSFQSSKFLHSAIPTVSKRTLNRFRLTKCNGKLGTLWTVIKFHFAICKLFIWSLTTGTFSKNHCPGFRWAYLVLNFQLNVL